MDEIGVKQKDLFRATHGVNPTEGSVKCMSLLDHGNICNRKFVQR